MLKIYATFLISAIPVLTGAHNIDFNKIVLWTGQGSNKAALVVQFSDDIDSHAYVWGYRWDDNDRPSGEKMFRDICANSSELLMLTQVTGQYGSTLCGIGFGNATAMIGDIYFDFEMAKDYEWINFDYFDTNSWFGQNGAPGESAPDIADKAISNAKISHVIQHPFDYTDYGYPAYDYDCWKLREGSSSGFWQSGWYAGYWSYWLSTAASSEWTYSGTGFSGRELTDGAIDAWVYTPFDVPGIGGFGEGNPPTNDNTLISYRPGTTSAVELTENTDNNEETIIYDLSGNIVATFMSNGSIPPLPQAYIFSGPERRRRKST